MKYIDEWNLSKKAKQIVKQELNLWKEEFKSRADGHTGQPRTVDFKNNDIFFFTKCDDIIGNNELEPGIKELMVRKRKRNVHLYLFLNELITGEQVHWRGHCNQCGKDIRIVFHLGLSGFVNYCPNCKHLKINTDVERLEDAIHVLAKTLKDRKIL